MIMFVNVQSGRIFDAIAGRFSEVVSPFLRKIARSAKNIKAVAVDMSQRNVKAIHENLCHDFLNDGAENTIKF